VEQRISHPYCYVEHCVLRSHSALLRSHYAWSDAQALVSALAGLVPALGGLALSTTQSFEKAIKSCSRSVSRRCRRRELPCFSEQEKTRGLNHLSA
jgi:hypothetical protein